jgi:hypothetical protein
MPVNDTLHGGQTNSRAFKFSDGMQPLKGPKEAVGIGWIESRAVVA